MNPETLCLKLLYRHFPMSITWFPHYRPQLNMITADNKDPAYLNAKELNTSHWKVWKNHRYICIISVSCIWLYGYTVNTEIMHYSPSANGLLAGGTSLSLGVYPHLLWLRAASWRWHNTSHWKRNDAKNK